MLAVVALKQPAMKCLTLCLLCGMNGVTVTISYCYLLLLWGLSDSGIAEPCFEGKKHEALDVWTCLGLKTLDMPKTFSRQVKENTLSNPPCPVTPPARHHLYTINLINGLHCFYRTGITMSLI